MTRLKPSSQKRAGLGVWACTRADSERQRLVELKGKAWRRCPRDVVQSIVNLIMQWCPVILPSWTIVAPPQGASAPGRYFAGELADGVARKLGLYRVDPLRRIDTKLHHGPWESMKQSPYRCVLDPDDWPLAIVVDDLVTSGMTMRLALGALHEAGVPAFGFAYSGC